MHAFSAIRLWPGVEFGGGEKNGILRAFCVCKFCLEVYRDKQKGSRATEYDHLDYPNKSLILV